MLFGLNMTKNYGLRKSWLKNYSLISEARFLFKCKCSQHVFPYIRGWMQMVLAQNDLFSETIIQWDAIPVMGMLHYCCTMHNDTHSVLNPSWSRGGVAFLALRHFYVFSTPLSGLNWCSLSVVGGPGPPTPKVASPLLGSAHTPLPGYGTIRGGKIYLLVGPAVPLETSRNPSKILPHGTLIYVDC